MGEDAGEGGGGGYSCWDGKLVEYSVCMTYCREQKRRKVLRGGGWGGGMLFLASCASVVALSEVLGGRLPTALYEVLGLDVYYEMIS